jgi:hypothetical protein
MYICICIYGTAGEYLYINGEYLYIFSGSILSKHVWRAGQVPVGAAMCKIMQKNGR